MSAERIAQILRLVDEAGIEQIRIAWCDLHGELRSKSIMPRALRAALEGGISMVGTQMLKDTSDRTAFAVFESGGLEKFPFLQAFAHASNFLLKPDLESFRILPWAQSAAWLQGELFAPNEAGNLMPIQLSSRQKLREALLKLERIGYSLQCGLELEFHIYKIENARPQLDPELAAWPGLPPAVSLIHPGYRLLSERWLDACEAPLQIVRSVCAGLGLPLTSLEIEFGPSQVEAVFAVQGALAAADTAVLFRNGVTQALRRAGYHASFMCRPPFESIMSSGWHLHQSLIELQTGRNALESEAGGLSRVGMNWLGGLLAHSAAICALANPGIDAYARFRPNALAPTAINWGVDARSATLRVISSGAATRIENRIGSPMANPYLYIAAQIHAGLDGLKNKIDPGAPQAPAECSNRLPTDLQQALKALENDAAMQAGFGADWLGYYAQIKGQELARYEQASDAQDWLRREYFARF